MMLLLRRTLVLQQLYSAKKFLAFNDFDSNVY